MKKTVAGIIAHVDAGKTTLSEGLLYISGMIRNLGRVDHGNAFLDNFEMERKRGITIFSKQAIIKYNNVSITLLDTPGHVDFSAETERVLDVLDCAIMVINAAEGVQSHTRTLWKLLGQRKIPTFIFVNKMDLAGTNKDEILKELTKELNFDFFDFRNPDLENLALTGDEYMEEYMESGNISPKSVSKIIKNIKASPCWFGSALKMQGVEEFLSDFTDEVKMLYDLRNEEKAITELITGNAIKTTESANAVTENAKKSTGNEKKTTESAKLSTESAKNITEKNENNPSFSAKIFKITRDSKGNRLTHMKITGGVIKIRDIISQNGMEEKITGIRIYSGEKYEEINRAEKGDVVAVSGLSDTLPGMSLGNEKNGREAEITPILTYSVIFPEECDIPKSVSLLRQLEEEDPTLNLSWDNRAKCLQIQLMGQIQLEVLKQIITERYGINVEFDSPKILYKETVEDIVEGVGHYEPLRHYAEVHLILKPGKTGSGIVIKTECSEDRLDKNWQRLIMTHLLEKQHRGVLTGSPITDIEIVLTAGKAHPKHTEGGDFRQATYRAVRQGLMKAKSVLLEPRYNFRLELPQTNLGRAINDLEQMDAEYESPEINDNYAVINGNCPALKIGSYSQTLMAYSKGLGNLICSFKGYFPCKNSEEIISEFKYNPESDSDNIADSIFCSHGAGHNVKWYDVDKYMHLESTLNPPEKVEMKQKAERYISRVASDEELMEIFERTYGKIKKDGLRKLRSVKKTTGQYAEYKPSRKVKTGPEYLLVDGYNIIFSWEELKELAKINIDAAREALIDKLINYQGFKQSPVILVFDAYKVKGNPGSIEKFGDLTVVFTKEAEIADTYIERAAYKLSKDRNVRVATSDRLEQMIILGNGALKISSDAFHQEVLVVEESIREVLENFKIDEKRREVGNRPVIK